jgi:hypothetical protein
MASLNLSHHGIIKPFTPWLHQPLFHHQTQQTKSLLHQMASLNLLHHVFINPSDTAKQNHHHQTQQAKSSPTCRHRCSRTTKSTRPCNGSSTSPYGCWPSTTKHGTSSNLQVVRLDYV